MSVSRTILFLLLPQIAALSALSGCGGGTAGPREGSPEWHWEQALFFYERAEFSKMRDEIDAVVASETPLKERARVWRTILLMGLARGYMEIGDAYRAGIEQNPQLRPVYDPLLLQVNHEARQFAIELTESLGDLDSAWGTDDVICQFPFPPASATAPLALEGISRGRNLPLEQANNASRRTVLRGIVLAATEFCGFSGLGNESESADAARAAFDLGPVAIANDDARFAMTKIMLDVSLIFSRKRANDAKIRLALVARAEQWSTPYRTSADAGLKLRSEELAREAEDERRDVRWDDRLLKKRE